MILVFIYFIIFKRKALTKYLSDCHSKYTVTSLKQKTEGYTEG